MYKSESKSRVLDNLILTRELSKKAVGMLSGYEENSVLMSKFRQEGITELIKANDLSGDRLTRQGTTNLKKTNDEYAAIMNGPLYNNRLRNDIVHRERYQMQSETVAFMQINGVGVMPKDKRSLSPVTVENKRDSESNESMSAIEVDIDGKPLTVESQPKKERVSYYQSIEIKSLFSDRQDIKIKNSRFTGMIRTEATDYLVYNFRDHMIKWEAESERRAKQIIGDKISKRDGQELKVIFLRYDMNIALQMLQSEGNKDARYFRISRELGNCIYIPMNKYGNFLYKIVIETDILSRATDRMLEKLHPAPILNGITADGILDGKTPFLFAFDDDLYRLLMFRRGLQVTRRKGVVYCFDFQTPVIRSFLSVEEADIRQMDANKFAGNFGLTIGKDGK